MAFDFRQLEVYKKAKQFHSDCIVQLTVIQPENYVKSQLGRASMSIVLNIAEGSGKFTKPDRRNFYVIARASIFECVAVLDILHDAQKLDASSFQKLENDAEELSKMLYAMIRNLENKN